MADDSIHLDALLHCLIECSEKAAKIAQIFRGDNDIFHLLVEEKSDLEKNKRFVKDFKTLADVLVQETIRKDVSVKFPTIIKIQGEEQNEFQNTLGESIKVELTGSAEDTTNLLIKVLDDKLHIAESLASAVHSTVTCSKSYCSPTTISASKIGIWIDPIDSTAEYIQAKHDDLNEYGISQCGLSCVCVLIGAYDLDTGIPFMGIINQPFHSQQPSSSKWQSKISWGLKYNSEVATSNTLKAETSRDQPIILMSSSENVQLKEIIKSKYIEVHAAGAGYKCLQVACAKADMYILSHGTTYFWDTCGPQAILLAEGGGIVSFKEAVSTTIKSVDDLEKCQIKYFSRTKSESSLYRNSGGTIAYRDPNVAIKFIHLLQENGYKMEKLSG